MCRTDFWCSLVQKEAFGTSSQFCHWLGRLICFSSGLLRAVFCLAQKCKRKGKTVHISSIGKSTAPRDSQMSLAAWWGGSEIICYMSEGLSFWKHILWCGLKSHKIHLLVQNRWKTTNYQSALKKKISRKMPWQKPDVKSPYLPCWSVIQPWHLSF